VDDLAMRLEGMARRAPALDRPVLLAAAARLRVLEANGALTSRAGGLLAELAEARAEVARVLRELETVGGNDGG
jgi:hypothetical protein